MKKQQLFRTFLFFSLAILMVGFLFWIMHWPGAIAFIGMAYLLSIVYIYLGLVEICKDQERTLIEKGAWLIGFLLLTPLAGLAYYKSEIEGKNSSS